jgi:hypothetical protein
MKQSIKLKRGDPYSKSIRFMDEDGNALNLTGRTIFCSIKSIDDNSDTDENALITKSITNHSNPTAGISVLTLLETDTDINPGIYKCDMKVYGEGINANTDSFYIEIERPVTERII